MAWKKHLKSVPDMLKENTQLDMKVRERLEEIVDDIKGSENAVALNFLIDHLHLAKDDSAAIQELKLKVDMMENVAYRVVIDDHTQDVYIQFLNPEKKEEE